MYCVHYINKIKFSLLHFVDFISNKLQLFIQSIKVRKGNIHSVIVILDFKKAFAVFLWKPCPKASLGNKGCGPLL